MPRRDNEDVFVAIDDRFRSEGFSLRGCTTGRTPGNGHGNISEVCRGHNTSNAPSCKNGKLRTHILSETEFLVIDLIRREVRLFRRENKKNKFIRSMPL